ncbi:MAG: DnaA regulatory inactivator Hda [Xanthomonadales bacterium]|nr:DnaA regulatory inactivator Hda [Gammaproteobacteria bacterium]MBT8053046.1 DnaA regulatory inactivator Hda [Gammaproteobacteria bacterium]NND56710.1 DnaA regulatory inactivator Hda [Xanthomonadales bacterium]NNK52695.1 DnaA regulatory inactivator Hda [Xanthomonadales bacterium]
MLFSPQIPLQLEPRRPDRLEDFVAGPNTGALAAVRHLLDEPGGSLFLSGPAGSGKSHLLNALCHLAREQGMGAFYIALKRLPEEAAASLEGLRVLDLVCVDDLDCVAGNPVWENALFACFNEVRAAQGRLLVSSSKPLAALDFCLPDLASRLAWGVRQVLHLPEDDGKLEILRQRARTLRIELPAEVQSYLLKHGKRDMASLLQTLEQLKDAAFSGKRKITVPLAREILKS